MDVVERQKIATINSIEMLESNYIQLGRPPFDHTSNAFWDFFEILVDLWHHAYPLEVVEWIETREDDLIEEKTLKEQVKSGLHKKYAFPMGLFRMVKTYWPEAQLMEPEFGRKFMRKFPLFRNSKYT